MLIIFSHPKARNESLKQNEVAAYESLRQNNIMIRKVFSLSLTVTRTLTQTLTLSLTLTLTQTLTLSLSTPNSTTSHFSFFFDSVYLAADWLIQPRPPETFLLRTSSSITPPPCFFFKTIPIGPFVFLFFWSVLVVVLLSCCLVVLLSCCLIVFLSCCCFVFLMPHIPLVRNRDSKTWQNMR